MISEIELSIFAYTIVPNKMNASAAIAIDIFKSSDILEKKGEFYFCDFVISSSSIMLLATMNKVGTFANEGVKLLVSNYIFQNALIDFVLICLKA